MRNVLRGIGHRLRGTKPSVPDDVVRGFLRILEDVRVEDMPCKQVFARLDEYVEKEVQGKNAADLMPLLREHLDLCPDCCEEYEALLRILEASSEGLGAAAP